MNFGMTLQVTLLFTITAYTNYDPGMFPCDGVMASGLQTFEGACACGPSFEFGTLFAIPDLGRVFV